MTPPPVSCVCLTYGRPHLLEEAIYSFLQQDYSGKKELIIINDDDQQPLYFDHPDIYIINISRKFKTLTDKHIFSIGLCSFDLIFLWDDAGIYLPHYLSESVHFFEADKNYYQHEPAWLMVRGQLLGLIQLTKSYYNIIATRQGWFNLLNDPTLLSPQKPMLTPAQDSNYLYRGEGESMIAPDKTQLTPQWQRDYQAEIQAYIQLHLDPIYLTYFTYLQHLFNVNINGPCFYILDDRKLVYLNNPKVACSSIKATILQNYDIHVTHTEAAHSHGFWRIERGNLSAARQSYYRFTFIRNPFERLVSCYRDKLVRKGDSPQPPPYFTDYLPVNIPFAEFILRVVKMPDFLADPHYQSQYYKLYKNGQLSVDFVGRFENLVIDWQQLAHKFNLVPLLVHLNNSTQKNHVQADYRLYYTPELVEMVYHRFKNDVDLLGYYPAYQELRAFVTSSFNHQPL